MQVGLLEGILGRFVSGKPVSGHALSNSENRMDAGNIIDSIKDNLSAMLNTRRGSVYHLPDYGLPDSTQVYMRDWDSITDFGRKIEETVRKYEPRLMQVHVKPMEKDSASVAEFRLGFLLEARVVNEETRFHALFKTTGSALIEDAKA